MGITTKQLAEICGVSRTTVVRALNDQTGISSKTKKLIVDTAKELGYRPDYLAKGLAIGKTMCIGVVVFDVINHYFAQLVNAIEIEARKNDYYVNIALQEKDREVEKQLINNLVNRRVDGIILCPVNKGGDYAEFIKELGIPVVIIGNMISENINFVGIDEKKASQDAVKFIVSKEYKKIVFVCPPLVDARDENVYTHEQRLSGFLEQVECEKVPYEVLGNWNYIDEFMKMIKNNVEKTAFFCSGDIYALNLVKIFNDVYNGIPDNIGIMGFDAIDILDYVNPRITTINSNVRNVGIEAVNSLVKLINGEEVEKSIILDHEVLEGKTI